MASARDCGRGCGHGIDGFFTAADRGRITRETSNYRKMLLIVDSRRTSHIMIADACASGSSYAEDRYHLLPIMLMMLHGRILKHLRRFQRNFIRSVLFNFSSTYFATHALPALPVLFLCDNSSVPACDSESVKVHGKQGWDAKGRRRG